jgi:plastocyanin
MRRLVLFALSLICGSSAAAADLSVAVISSAGKPVPDAVVTLVPAAGAPKRPIKFPWPYRVEQRDMQFQPFVLIVPSGALVSFPNRDPVRHHVYSFSPAKRFELKLYGKDETRSVAFENAGAVALGCNIHDSMVAFIRVVDTPWAAKTDAQGRVSLAGVPGGPARLAVWHPYGKAAEGEIARQVRVPASGGREVLVLDVRPPARRRGVY